MSYNSRFSDSNIDNVEFVMNVKNSKSNFNNYKYTNFRISKTIYFNDDIWDFNYLNKNNRLKLLYRYDFTTIPSQFVFVLKHIILHEIFFVKNSFGSINNTFTINASFFREMDNLGINNILLLDRNSIKAYFLKKQQTVSNARLETLCSHIIKIFEFLEDNTNINYSGILQFIKNVSTESRRNYKTAYSAKNDYIPDSFLDQTIALAIKDMNNENVKLNHRIVACLLIIIAETGMRVEEAALLESSMLDTINIESNNKSLNYLKFKTFKT